MYHAKDAGKNHVCFFQNAMNDGAVERFETVNGLRDAISGGELALDFQPQVDLAQEELDDLWAYAAWLGETEGGFRTTAP